MGLENRCGGRWRLSEGWVYVGADRSECAGACAEDTDVEETGLGITTEDESLLLLLGIALASIFRLYESGLSCWV